MKINTHHNTRKYIASIIILAIVIGAGAFAYYRNSSKSTETDSQTTNLKSATAEEKAAGIQAKSSSAESADTSSNSTKNDSSESTSSATDSTVNVQLSASSQNGTVYQIRYLISSVISNATCTLALSNGSQTITKTAQVQALAQSSTCAGFDVPMSELSTGTWQASLKVIGSGITGSSQNTIQIK